MITSFKRRGLKRFYERDDRGGIRPDLIETVEDILARLDRAETAQAMKGSWSVTVRANWRIVFRFEGTDAFDVELTDYH